MPDDTNITGGDLPYSLPLHEELQHAQFRQARYIKDLSQVLSKPEAQVYAAAALEALHIPQGTIRVLFKTLNSKK